jgi:hypothetical protein
VLRGVLDEPVVGGVVQSAESQGGPHVVALGRVVVDDVHDDLDVGLVEGLDHRLELVDLPSQGVRGGVAVVGREEADRVVPPVVRQAAALQRGVVDELVAGHELDRRDAQPGEVVDHDRMADARVGPPVLLGDVRVEHRHAAYVGLVDDRVVVLVIRRAVVAPVEEGIDDHGGHRVGGRVELAPLGRVVEVVGEERLFVLDRAVDGFRIRVEQELRTVAPQAPGGIVGARHAETVLLPGPHSRQVAMPYARVDFT